MENSFNIKKRLSFDADIFDDMKKTAAELLRNTKKKDNAQAIVLLTSHGNKYAAFIEDALSVEKADENNLMNRLIDAKDTEVDFVLCLWQGGEIDIPSFAFRKMLLSLNPQNSSSAIFVMTGRGYSVIELGITIKA